MKLKVLLLFSLFALLALVACNTAGEGIPEAETPVIPAEQAATSALIDYLEGQGAPVQQMDVQVKKIAGDYALIEVISTDPASPGGFNAFMKHENGVWTTLVSGSGLEKEQVEALGIPQSVWPEVWLTQADQPAITAQPTIAFSEDGCPMASAESQTQPLLDEARGFCLLYPASHTVEQLESGNTEIVLGSIMNHVDPRASIVVEELAGRSLEQVVDEFLAGYEGFTIDQSPLTVGGEAAILLDNIPGQDYYRKVLVVHDGFLYQLTIAPYDQNLVDSLPQAEQLYHTVIDSFRFVDRGQEPTAGPAPAVPAEIQEVATLPVPSTTYRDEVYGFEFDYPAAWTLSDQGVIGSRASAVQFLDGDRIAMQMTLYRWDPQNDLAAYIDHRKAAWTASGANVVSLEEWIIDDTHPAASFVFQTEAGDEAFFFFTAVGDQYLELAGEGDGALLSQIARTVRFPEA